MTHPINPDPARYWARVHNCNLVKFPSEHGDFTDGPGWQLGKKQHLADIKKRYPMFILRYARLPGANFVGNNMTGMDLAESNLCGADLSGANLTNANLFKADLTNATLFRTILDGADLTGTILDNVDLDDVIGLRIWRGDDGRYMTDEITAEEEMTTYDSGEEELTGAHSEGDSNMTDSSTDSSDSTDETDYGDDAAAPDGMEVDTDESVEIPR